MSRRLDILLERAKQLLYEAQDVATEVEPAIEMHVFDFDQTIHDKYKSLQCADILKQHIDAGIPCYVVTARKKNSGQEKHIVDTCKRWGIKLNQKDIFCLGEENPKGPVVRSLIDKHQPERCTFWDDKQENCESVYDSCYDACEDLHIYWMSLAVPGDVRMEIRSDINNERIETKPTLQERKLFRNWRRLSGI